jgi:hypothetical protein
MACVDKDSESVDADRVFKKIGALLSELMVKDPES